MIAVQHARLLGRKPEFVLFGLEGVDALKQRLVQIGLAAMAGEHRRDVPLDRLELVVRHGAREIEKDISHAIERTPAALHGLDRVGEGRGRRVGADGVDLGARVLEGGVECGPEVTRFNALERRRLEKPGPGFEKRVRVDARVGHHAS